MNGFENEGEASCVSRSVRMSAVQSAPGPPPSTPLASRLSDPDRRVADRYFRAELLQQSGRTREALDAYGAVADYSLDGLMYLPMSHLRRGDIYLQMGDRTRATQHYSRAVALWRDCDPALRPIRSAAEKKIVQLSRR